MLTIQTFLPLQTEERFTPISKHNWSVNLIRTDMVLPSTSTFDWTTRLTFTCTHDQYNTCYYKSQKNKVIIEESKLFKLFCHCKLKKNLHQFLNNWSVYLIRTEMILPSTRTHDWTTRLTTFTHDQLCTLSYCAQLIQFHFRS